jgi:hypothetical protein
LRPDLAHKIRDPASRARISRKKRNPAPGRTHPVVVVVVLLVGNRRGRRGGRIRHAARRLGHRDLDHFHNAYTIPYTPQLALRSPRPDLVPALHLPHLPLRLYYTIHPRTDDDAAPASALVSTNFSNATEAITFLDSVCGGPNPRFSVSYELLAQDTPRKRSVLVTTKPTQLSIPDRTDAPGASSW